MTASGFPAKAVTGFPADTVIWAIDQHGIDFIPDLVISGANDGQNLGPVVDLSGTVGAARAAATRNIPAIAVSAGLGEPADFAAATDAFVGYLTAPHRRDRRPCGGHTGGRRHQRSTHRRACTGTAIRGTVEVPLATDLQGYDYGAPVDCNGTLDNPVDDVQAYFNGYAAISADAAPARPAGASTYREARCPSPARPHPDVVAVRAGCVRPPIDLGDDRAGSASWRSVGTRSTPRSRQTRRSRSPNRVCAAWAAATCSRSCTSSGSVHALDASGRAGAGADAAAMRADRADPHPAAPRRASGHRARLCQRLDRTARAVRPRCPWRRCWPPPSGSPEHGFPASPLLVGSLGRRGARTGTATSASSRVRPFDVGAGSAGQASAARCGRSPPTAPAAFYEGEFERRPAPRSATGLFTSADLARREGRLGAAVARRRAGATRCGACRRARRATCCSAPPAWPSAGLPADPSDPVVAAPPGRGGRSPPAATVRRGCFEGADGDALVDELAARHRRGPGPTAPVATPQPAGPGDTTYLCTIDERRDGRVADPVERVGVRLVARRTRDRHQPATTAASGSAWRPAIRPSCTPVRRPPHTLCAAMATDAGRRPAAVFGTMGGDGQPQILLQLAARLLARRSSRPVRRRRTRRRWALQPHRAPASTGFDTWANPTGRIVTVEDDTPAGWVGGLEGAGTSGRRALARRQVRPRARDHRSTPMACRRGAHRPAVRGVAPRRTDRPGSRSAAATLGALGVGDAAQSHAR